MINNVEYGYSKGSLGAFVKDALADKATNSSLIASDFIKNIQGSFYNKDATVEERAINREMA